MQKVRNGKLCCVYGYYVFATIQNQNSFRVGFYTILWSLCSLIGGGIFGIGAYYANSNTNWLKYAGLNLLPSVFFAEGINRIIHIREYSHMIPAMLLLLVIGTLLYFLLNKKMAFKRKNLFATALLTMAGIPGYEILFWVTT